MKGFSGNVVGLWLFIGWLLAVGHWLLAVGYWSKAKCQKLKAFPLNSSMSIFLY